MASLRCPTNSHRPWACAHTLMSLTNACANRWIPHQHPVPALSPHHSQEGGDPTLLLPLPPHAPSPRGQVYRFRQPSSPLPALRLSPPPKTHSVGTFLGTSKSPLTQPLPSGGPPAPTMHCSSPPLPPTLSLVGLSVPVRKPLGLALWMPDTEQKARPSKAPTAAAKKEGHRPAAQASSLPPPSASPRWGGRRESSACVLSMTDATTRARDGPPDHAYI